ncbi:MAG: hypothetical protein KGY44_09730 [Halanaerobiales bacterium]|nr:hypothetical protein [Halanaerobiales bacterium]
MGLINQKRGYKINLLNVNYEYIDFDEEIAEDFEFIVSDDYEIDSFNEDMVSIILSRKVYYKPEIIFNISVTLQIIYNINKDSEQELNKNNLEKELESKKKLLLEPLVSKASLLIANITNADDDLNVITPPFLQQTKLNFN